MRSSQFPEQVDNLLQQMKCVDICSNYVMPQIGGDQIIVAERLIKTAISLNRWEPLTVESFSGTVDWVGANCGYFIIEDGWVIPQPKIGELFPLHN